jgi:hypothetical protein
MPQPIYPRVKIPQYPQKSGWIGPRTGLHSAEGKRETLALGGKRFTTPRLPSPLHGHYINRAISGPEKKITEKENEHDKT